MRIVYPESRRFRISFVVERVCRSANTGYPVPSRDRIFCAVSARAAFRGCMWPLFPRTGPGRGREGEVSGVCMPGRVPCPYNLQACADMPGQGCPSGGAPGAGASSLPATDSISLFSAGIAAGSGAAVILFWNCRFAAGASGLLRAASSSVPYAGEVGFSPARLRGYGLVWPGC